MANRYSVASGDWDDINIWSATSGGTPGASVPTTAVGDVFIEGGYTVTITAVNSGCVTLSIGDNSTLNIGATTLLVAGTTLVGGGTNGTLNITSTSGGKTFTGLVTIASGGLWNNTANRGVAFRGGITNNGTFNAGSASQQFAINNQTLSGTFSIPFVTVTGITLTNNGALSVGTTLAGTGTLTQATTGVLNIGCTVVNLTITNLNATASGNVVNYTNAGNQTVKATAYDNLSLSGSGTKTISAGIVIAKNLSISGTSVASLTGTANTANWLYFGGILQPTGSWGATGSGATNIDNTHFSGSGYVSITSTITGKKWQGITISKWNGVVISKINGV